MKSILAFGLMGAGAVATGPQARKLAVWDFDGGLSGAATGGHQECYFRSTDALFEKTWTVAEYSADGNPLDGVNLVEGGAYHSNKRSPASDWTNTSVPILIARFDVDLTLDNYVAATQDAATKNYKYYDYHTEGSPGWVATALDSSTGTEKMTSICVKKKDHPDPAVCTANNDIIVEVDDGGDNGEHGTPVTVNLGVRKTLGIATTCGESGDLGGGLTSNSDDIFVWGTLSAEQTLTFMLTRNHQGPDAYSLTDSGTSEPDEDTIDGNNYVNLELSVTAPQPVTHDLLFIEEHVTDSQYLFSSHPGCNPDANGECQDNTEYRIDIGSEADESQGAIQITNSQKTVSCDVSLTVFSGRPNHWHCFRDAASQFVPGSGHDSTDFTAGDGNAALATLSAVAASTLSPTGTAGQCAAQLEVECGNIELTVSGTDNRVCDFSTAFGDDAPHEDSGGAAGNNVAELARQAAYKQCVESAWFQDKSYFLNDIMLEGSYDAAIVQAVRLTQTRRYPKDAKNTDIVVGTSFADVSTNWECTTDCSDEDPYRVLSSDEVTAKSQFNEALSFITEDVDDSNPNGNYKSQYVADGGTRGAATADHSITTTCTCSGIKAGNDCCTDGPDYDSGKVALENPPAGFPESYVFGVVSFDFRSNQNDGTDIDLFVRPGGIEDDNADVNGERKRRLLRSSAPTSVQKTLLVNAVQNVINK